MSHAFKGTPSLSGFYFLSAFRVKSCSCLSEDNSESSMVLFFTQNGCQMKVTSSSSDAQSHEHSLLNTKIMSASCLKPRRKRNFSVTMKSFKVGIFQRDSTGPINRKKMKDYSLSRIILTLINPKLLGEKRVK